MKKIVSVLLCLVLVLTTLVACKEEEYGYKGEYDAYYSPDNRSNVSLDFYIVYGGDTEDNANAIKTVSRMINQYISDKFTTTVNMHYVTASEYAKQVSDSVAKTDATRADIVLIVGEEMFDSLDGKLLNIKDYYNSTDFGRLKTNITASLYEASYVGENIYTVPNNRIIDSYDFILINRNIAEQTYNFGTDKTKTWNTRESVQPLIDSINNAGLHQVSDVVKFETGSYDDIAKFESQGYICNIEKYPTVDRAGAFASAFAIVKDVNDNGEFSLSGKQLVVPEGETAKAAPDYIERYYRAMEVIYTLNTDVYFRNLLQYGVQGTNYVLVDAAAPDSSKEVIMNDPSSSNYYIMNITYTGDLFNAYFCDAIGWTEALKECGTKQNAQSVVVAPDTFTE